MRRYFQVLSKRYYLSQVTLFTGNLGKKPFAAKWKAINPESHIEKEFFFQFRVINFNVTLAYLFIWAFRFLRLKGIVREFCQAEDWKRLFWKVWRGFLKFGSKKIWKCFETWESMKGYGNNLIFLFWRIFQFLKKIAKKNFLTNFLKKFHYIFFIFCFENFQQTTKPTMSTTNWTTMTTGNSLQSTFLSENNKKKTLFLPTFFNVSS